MIVLGSVIASLSIIGPTAARLTSARARPSPAANMAAAAIIRAIESGEQYDRDHALELARRLQSSALTDAELASIVEGIVRRHEVSAGTGLVSYFPGDGILVPMQSGVHPSQPELVRFAVIRRVTVNGAPAAVRASPFPPAAGADAHETPLVFRERTPAYFIDPLPRGECIIVVELEMRLYRRFDVERLRDERYQWRPVATWVEPLAQHRHVTSCTGTIGSDESVAIPPPPSSPASPPLIPLWIRPSLRNGLSTSFR
ncbi:MAG: hypothetical protein SGJ11_18285 [Phycisphaerae bacterium]|nr:hypothetical protein [Phycisphaerae bacterium]